VTVDVVHEDGFGQLELQALGRDPRLLERACDRLDERPLGDLTAGDVDRDAQVAPPGRLPARLTEHPVPERHDEA
jgi:hypothetical protein